jgi:hypothetical protein
VPADDRHRRPLVAVLAVALVAVTTACGSGSGGRLAERQADVAERGARVMPFDLGATTHTFIKTEDGGRQIVVADDPGDGAQIELIQQHLREERANFARGDFDDPAAIHGHDMDGVAELQAGFADIGVDYTERPDGAELTYRTEDGDLVDALHAWFDRQVSDHGSHAEAG